ncbi:TrmB family transcriptional regulator [Candidatus Woesearchaeota archaeon]|nr:TrmB family transcriptional regulator [Candidatus Woesearchaeota archaeon]
MIVQKEFLNKLNVLGLNSYEAKLWAALLSRGVSTAGELSDIANVPRSRSYDVLESLEKKGFVVMKLGKPIKYIAVKPSDVLERVKQRIMEEAEHSSQSLDNLRDSEMLKELNLLHSKGIDMVDPSELSGSFKGRNNLYTHLESMMKSAEKSITIVTTKDGLNRKAESFRRALYRAKENGVKIQIVAPITKDNMEAAKKLSEYADVRNSDANLGRFIIVDDNQLTFMLVDDADVHPNYDSGVWVNSPFFAATMSSLFALNWKKLTPLNKL